MKNTGIDKLLIIGVGNSGRRDDGLGWALLDLLKKEDHDFIKFEYRYQLQIEDAALIALYSRVLFVDATEEIHPEGYSLSILSPKPANSYTSHAIPPAQILYLCQDLYQAYPQCHLLTISGREWGLQLGLSEQARNNLNGAKSFLSEWMGMVA
jgi:hydrogenase maturation protease